MDNEKMDKQGTKNLEEKEASKQVDRNQQQKKQSSGDKQQRLLKRLGVVGFIEKYKNQGIAFNPIILRLN